MGGGLVGRAWEGLGGHWPIHGGESPSWPLLRAPGGMERGQQPNPQALPVPLSEESGGRCGPPPPFFRDFLQAVFKLKVQLGGGPMTGLGAGNARAPRSQDLRLETPLSAQGGKKCLR